MKLYIGTRQPAASSSTDPAPNLVKDDFPEALTYRFNDNSAWVPAARTHDVSSGFLIVLIVRLTSRGRRTGGCRPREARLPGIEERPTRSHHIPHNWKIQYCMHHTGGMATCRAAPSPIPRRRRENTRHRRT
jgi:hypothetical protein